MSQLKYIEPRVEEILFENDSARNNDRVLYVRYLQKFHNVKTIEDIISGEIPAMESLSRIRRKIQSTGKYPSNSEVHRIRDKAQQDYIDYNYSN